MWDRERGMVIGAGALGPAKLMTSGSRLARTACGGERRESSKAESAKEVGRLTST